MSERTVSALTIVVLFLLVTVPMIDQGKPLAAVGFAAFLMIPYGFGRLLWSERRLSDWRGWLSILTGIAIASYLGNPILFAYAGLAVIAQIVARFMASFLVKRTQDDNDDA